MYRRLKVTPLNKVTTDPLPPLRSLPRLPLPYRNSDAGIQKQLWNSFHEVKQPLPSFAEQTDETQAFTEPATEDASSFSDPGVVRPRLGPNPADQVQDLGWPVSYARVIGRIKHIPPAVGDGGAGAPRV